MGSPLAVLKKSHFLALAAAANSKPSPKSFTWILAGEELRTLCVSSGTYDGVILVNTVHGAGVLRTEERTVSHSEPLSCSPPDTTLSVNLRWLLCVSMRLLFFLLSPTLK